MRLKIWILIFSGLGFFGFSQSPDTLNFRQISHEISHELINQTLNNAGRVVASPLKFSINDWAYTGAAIGVVALAYSQDVFFYNKLRGGEGSVLRGLASYVGEPFGNPYYVLGGSLGLYLIGKGIKKKSVSEPALLAFQSAAIGGGAALFFKLLLHRQRPNEGLESNPTIFKGPSFHSTNLSFPSGHTTTAFAVASALSTYYRDKKEVGVILYTLAGVTAWSRIHDNEHWFSDVMAGAVLGYFVGRTVARPEVYRWSVLPNSAGGISLGFNYSF